MNNKTSSDKLGIHYLNIAKQMGITFTDSPLPCFFRNGFTFDKAKPKFPKEFSKLDAIINQCEGNYERVPYRDKNNFEEIMNQIAHYSIFPQGLVPSGKNYPHTWGG